MVLIAAAATGGGASSARARRLSPALVAGAAGTWSGLTCQPEQKQPKPEISSLVSRYVSASAARDPAGNQRRIESGPRLDGGAGQGKRSRFFNSRNGAVGKDQFVPSARAVIFHNRVKQGLMDIQFVRYSSGLFEIVSGNVIGYADDNTRDGIFEVDNNLGD